jgi:hypothetical protein
MERKCPEELSKLVVEAHALRSLHLALNHQMGEDPGRKSLLLAWSKTRDRRDYNTSHAPTTMHWRTVANGKD